MHLQSNFSDSDIFGTMESSTRHGYFQPLRFIIAPGRETNEDNLGMSFRYSLE